MDVNAALLKAAAYAAAVLLVLGFAAVLRRRLALFPAAVLVLLPLLFCAPGFFANRTLFPTDHVRQIPPWTAVEPGGTAPRRHNPNLNDAVTQIAPWTAAVRLAWREGSLPWNDRWNGCGTPLAANGQSGAFSPFTLLLFPLALADAFTVGAAVRLLLALSGTFLWMREMKVSTPAALFAAVSFAFSMTMTPWLLFPLSAVLCLWPWALFTVELALAAAPEGSARRGAVALTAVLACWVLVGHPESAALGGAAIGIFLAARLLLRDPRMGRAGLLRIAGAAAAAAGLTAFLWLPQAFAVRASNRLVLARQVRQALPASAVPHAPAWPAGFLMPVFPRLFGDDVAAPLAPGAASSFPEMAMPYFGAIGAALALLLALPGARRDPRGIAAAAALGAGLLVGSGTWPLFDAFVASPVVGLVSPLRPLSWVALMGSAIAGFELDRLRRTFADQNRRRHAVLAAPIVVAAVAVAAFLRASAALPSGQPRQALAGAALAGALAAAAVPLSVFAALLLAWRSRPRFAAGAALGLAAAAGAELFVQGERLYAWGDPRDAFPQTPLTRFLASRPRPFRVVGADAALFPGTNLFAGAEDVRVHDAVERRAYVTLLDREAGYPPAEYFKRVRNLDAPLLDFLNVRYLITGDRSRPSTARWTRVYEGPDGAVFESAGAAPRVFSATADISDYSDTANTVTFRARNGSDHAAVAVASVVQDGGWSARDERNKAVPAEVANAMFLALSVPPGDHRIRLEYTPPGLRQGAAISAAAAAILAADALRRRRFAPRQRRAA
jgi:Bacterial membrane protein YfhO